MVDESKTLHELKVRKPDLDRIGRNKRDEGLLVEAVTEPLVGPVAHVV